MSTGRSQVRVARRFSSRPSASSTPGSIRHGRPLAVCHADGQDGAGRDRCPRRRLVYVRRSARRRRRRAHGRVSGDRPAAPAGLHVRGAEILELSTTVRSNRPLGRLRLTLTHDGVLPDTPAAPRKAGARSSPRWPRRWAKGSAANEPRERLRRRIPSRSISMTTYSIVTMPSRTMRFQGRQQQLDLVLGVDDLDDHRQIARHFQQLRFVNDAVGAKSFAAAQHRRAGQLQALGLCARSPRRAAGRCAGRIRR